MLDARGVRCGAGRIPILIDTDFATNVDDLLAVLFAAGSEVLDLVAVTTVHGLPEVRGRSVRYVLDLAGKVSVPVGVGRIPVKGELFVSGYEKTYAPPRFQSGELASAHSVFKDALQQHGDNLVVAAIGPLSNVAAWLSEPLKCRPRLVLAMAGCFKQSGTDRNVGSDAAAARKLAEAGVPILFVGIEVCRQVIYGPEDLDEIGERAGGSELYKLLETQSRNWWSFKGRPFSNPCDPLTLMALASPNIFSFQRADVSFVVGGERSGQTIWTDHKSGRFLRATTVDSDSARHQIVSTVSTALRSASDNR